ncbi:MAG: aminoglycoside phosphotransferase family protein [Anaerolineae bacterium]|nr:aminoglycoside phosphotransferase family protein [Anaerolineae bacterium]
MSAPVTPEQALSLVRQVFQDAVLISIEPFPGIHENQNYDLKIRNPTLEAAIKVYRDMTDQKPWQEARLLNLLTSETGVPVPRILHFDDSGTLLPVPWILYTRLPGQPLADVLDDMDEWALEAIGYEMGRYLAHIHQIPLEVFGNLFEPEAGVFDQEKAFVLDLADRCLTPCVAGGLIQPAAAEHIRHTFETSTVLTQSRACLIHGNYTPSNIIVEFNITDYHITGVLDLTQATGSCPEHDISPLFNQSFEGKPSFQKGFLDGYTESAEMKAHFWERIKVYRLLAYLEQAARLCAQETSQQERARLVQTLLHFVEAFEKR